MARLEPIPPGDWPAAMKDALAALRSDDPRHPFPPRDPSRPKGLHALGLFAHHPQLTKAYNAFTGHVLFGTSLSLRHRELLVLRVAAVRDSAYEWAQHVILGRDAGLSDEEIDRVRDDPASAAWSPLERALFSAVDELIGGAALADETYAALAEEFSAEQLLDTVFTVGNYDLLAMAFGAFRIPVDDDLK